MNVAVLAAIPAQTGLLAWLEGRGCRTLRSTEADLSRIHPRLGLIGARLWPWTLNAIAAVMSGQSSATNRNAGVETNSASIIDSNRGRITHTALAAPRKSRNMTTYTNIPAANQAGSQAEPDNKPASADPISARDLENTTGSSADLYDVPHDTSIVFLPDGPRAWVSGVYADGFAGRRIPVAERRDGSQIVVTLGRLIHFSEGGWDGDENEGVYDLRPTKAMKRVARTRQPKKADLAVKLSGARR
jgi:hypothetical protein